jgi:hypothetical protein
MMKKFSDLTNEDKKESLLIYLKVQEKLLALDQSDLKELESFIPYQEIKNMFHDMPDKDKIKNILLYINNESILQEDIRQIVITDRTFIFDKNDHLIKIREDKI